jgi:hypothetical protein
MKSKHVILQVHVLFNKGVNLSQKVGGTDSKLGMSGDMLPDIFF